MNNLTPSVELASRRVLAGINALQKEVCWVEQDLYQTREAATGEVVEGLVVAHTRLGQLLTELEQGGGR